MRSRAKFAAYVSASSGLDGESSRGGAKGGGGGGSQYSLASQLHSSFSGRAAMTTRCEGEQKGASSSKVVEGLRVKEGELQ